MTVETSVLARYSEDDDGHVFFRGQRMAVCARTCKVLTGPAYGGSFIGIAPLHDNPGVPWCAPSGTLRPVSETKGARHHQDTCGGGGGCC